MKGTDSAARVVLVTAPSGEAAESLVRRVVEERVAACGNILAGLTSIYHWEGAIERATEALIIFKTTAEGARRLVELVPELHPYDVPEVLVLPVESGHVPYLAWIEDTVNGSD